MPRAQTQLVSMNPVRNALSLGSAANVFRLAASKDPEKAVAAWGTNALRDKWSRQISKHGLITPEMLSDFFSSAMVWIGRIQTGRCVVALYNVWSDTILFLDMEASAGTHPRLNDFVLANGELWRGEPPTTAAQVLQRNANRTLLEKLAGDYYNTKAKFEREFPPMASFSFDPTITLGLSASEEGHLSLTHLRMLTRMAMYSQLFAGSDASQLESIVLMRRLLRETVSLKWYASFSTRPDSAAVEAWLALPVEVRESAGPVLAWESADSRAVAWTSAFAPRYFCLIEISRYESNHKFSGFSVFDLELSREYLARSGSVN